MCDHRTIALSHRRTIAPQTNLISLDRDAHDSTGAESSKQEHFRQWLLDDPFDEPGHGPGTEGAVEALRCQPGPRRGLELDGHVLRCDQGSELVDLPIDDTLDLGGTQRVEMHGGVEPVTEFRRERPFERAAGRPAGPCLAKSHAPVREVPRADVG